MKRSYEVFLTTIALIFFIVAGVQTIRYEREHAKRDCNVCIMSDKEPAWVTMDWVHDEVKEDLRKAEKKVRGK